jgi:hypothetical protein
MTDQENRDIEKPDIIGHIISWVVLYTTSYVFYLQNDLYMIFNSMLLASYKNIIYKLSLFVIAKILPTKKVTLLFRGLQMHINKSVGRKDLGGQSYKRTLSSLNV